MHGETLKFIKTDVCSDTGAVWRDALR